MEKSRFVFQWDEQPMQMCKVLCSLMESQSLVDLTIICNSYTIKVHKCVMAANSSYFRERLQKDAAIDRVVINGIKHPVLKSLIEYIYCGETSVSDEYIPELIEAAKFLGILGISAICPQKLGCENPEAEINLINKPPVFFSKNEKSRYYFKEKDINLFERNIKFMVDGANYPMYDSNRRRRPSQPKVADGAHIALAKEEAASRQALEMLQKDMTSTGNVFVIDESCTEATVQTDLSSPFENPRVMQIQEFVIENDIKTSSQDFVHSPEPTDLIATNLLNKFKGVQFQTKRSPESNNCSETYEIQGTLPVLYKSADGNFLNVSNQILENLTSSQGIEYHVIPSDNNEDFQQYICNNFDGYSVEIHDPRTEQIVDNYEIVKQDTSIDDKKQLTYTQLVADTVNSDYESAAFESHYSGNVALVENIDDGPTIQIITNDANTQKITEEPFISNYPLNYSSKQSDKAKDMDGFVPNEIIPKRKRGRPPKRKLVDVSCEASNTPAKTDYIYNEKSQKVSQVIEIDLVKNNQLSVNGHGNVELSNTLENSIDNKENDDPFKIYTKTDIPTNNKTSNDIITNKDIREKPFSFVAPVTPLNDIENIFDENRRQTRSTSKLNVL